MEQGDKKCTQIIEMPIYRNRAAGHHDHNDQKQAKHGKKTTYKHPERFATKIMEIGTKTGL
jgi:hypothetical protein